MVKSVSVAYVLWFLFGWLGVHQFYLKRDRHAFFTFATLGGVLGLGWFRDLFYIPKYAAEANETPEYLEKHIEQLKTQKPSYGTCRWAASALLGNIFSLLVYAMLDSETLNENYRNAVSVCAHVVAALGVYIVMNEGKLKVSFKWCLLGALMALPLTLKFGPDYYHYGALGASMVSTWKLDWRRQPRQDGLCKRLFIMSLLTTAYLGAVSSSIYYNATITTKEGETVPLREAVQNFFKSPAWRETKETLNQIYQYYKHHGWRTLWQEIVNAIDPQGEANAYEMLGVASAASQSEIKSSYKKLALKYHPDKAKDAEQRKEFEEKFMEIQQAYDILSKIKQGRNKKNII